MSSNTTHRLLESCGIREPLAKESKSPFDFPLLNKADYTTPSVFRTMYPRFSKQTSISSFSLFNKVLIALLFVASFSVESYATHDRGGSLTWQQAGGNSIKFTLNTSWRRSYYGTPVVGSVITLNGNPNQFNFGDGSPIVTNMQATVTSINVAEDVLTATWTVTRTYSQPGNYTASFLNCCRLSTLIDGNNDTNFKLETTVNVGLPYWNPATTSLPAVINLSLGQSAATFQVPAQGKDNQIVRFRPSTTAESGLVKPVPTGFNISSSGVITFNTIGLQAEDLFAVQIIMESVNPINGLINNKVPVDFIIEIVGLSMPPIFISPTPLPPNNVFNVFPGNPVNFTVAARDLDGGQYVTLNPVAAPVSSTMSPTLPVVGAVNGTASSTFSWTPTASQIGNYVITFVAADNVGVQKLTAVTINVLCALNATVSNTTSTSCTSTSDGAAQITVQNFTSAANLLYVWTGPNSFTASTQNISGVAAGSYSVKVIDNANGCNVTRPVTIGTIPDITPPTITCPSNIPCVEATSPAGAVVTFANATATDNCGAATVTSSPMSGSLFPIGTTTVVMTATDGSSNITTCQFTVSVCDRTPPVIHNTPANIPCVEATSPAGAVVTYANPTATDIVDGAVSVISVPASGSTFPLGTTTITSTATDAHGNSSSTSFTVTVCDRTPPVISCPIPLSKNTDIGVCGAVTTFGIPTVTDNTSATIAQTAGLANGATFPVGVSTIIFTATDASGNTSSCSFNVTVTDNEKPVITCPTPLSKNTDLGVCGAITTFGTATVTDNCSAIVTQTAGLANGVTFPVGVSTIIFTATDASSNTSSCSFNVTVTDNEKPSITAPGNITVCAGSPVTLGTPTRSDNCGILSVSNNAPATYPSGTTTVIWIATDVNSNTATASQTVTIPVIAIGTPSVTNVKCYGGSDGKVIIAATGGTNTFTYKRSGSATTNTTGIFTGLAAGTYTFTATDGNGCTVTATATVTQPTQVSVNAGNCQFVYYGYGSNCATLLATATGGIGAFTYAWSAGSASGSSTQVCPTTTTTYTVTATDQNGCTATNTVKVEVIDVRCGNKNDKVSICHNGNVLCVAPSAIPAHLEHGDNLGTCGATLPCGSLNSIVHPSNGAATAIHTKEGEIGMTVYPNPAQNEVNVTLENITEGDATILILDITGKVMSNTQQRFSEGYNALTLDVKDFSSGLYYIKVQMQGEQPIVQKLQIIQ